MATHYQGLGQGNHKVGSYKLEASLDEDGGLMFTYLVKVRERERERAAVVCVCVWIT